MGSSCGSYGDGGSIGSQQKAVARRRLAALTSVIETGWPASVFFSVKETGRETRPVSGLKVVADADFQGAAIATEQIGSGIVNG